MIGISARAIQCKSKASYRPKEEGSAEARESSRARNSFFYPVLFTYVVDIDKERVVCANALALVALEDALIVHNGGVPG